MNNSNTQNPRTLLQKMRDFLKGALVDRDHPVDVVLISMLTGMPCFLYGPPGTAKSLLLDTLCKGIGGARSFRWLLTAFTSPEELFGPISVKGLQNDRMVRVNDNKLPSAHMVFLDEIFKANSAILNSLLTATNEGIHFNPDPQPLPMRVCLAASNEIPEESELAALYDRFTLRLDIRYLSTRDDRRDLLMMAGIPAKGFLTLDQLDTLRAETLKVSIPDAIVETLLDIWEAIEAKGFTISDRKMRQALNLLRGAAYLDGENEVSEDHLWILGDTLWDKPEDRGSIMEVISKIANPMDLKVGDLLDAAREAVNDLGVCPKVGNDGWFSKAGRVNTALTDILREITVVIGANPKAKHAKVKTQVEGYLYKVKTQVAEAYGL